MHTLLGYFNRLIPFATPGVPLLQDITHLAAICILIYFAPRLQELLRPSRGELTVGTAETEIAAHGVIDAPAADQDDEHQLQWDAGDIEAPHPEAIEGEAGPANVANLPAQRTAASTKKAKSLARKDQRRAYNEWLRSQGDLQRARDQEGAEERERVLAAERERRLAAEVALETKRAEERRKRKLREETERLEEMRRRELAVQIVKEALGTRKSCDLFKVAKQVGGDVDEEWVERLLMASGLIGRRGDTFTMITKMGWAVKVTADDMSQVYAAAVKTGVGDTNGTVDYDDIGKLLDRLLRPGQD